LALKEEDPTVALAKNVLGDKFGIEEMFKNPIALGWINEENIREMSRISSAMQRHCLMKRADSEFASILYDYFDALAPLPSDK
jgi:hypothetical protein